MASATVYFTNDTKIVIEHAAPMKVPSGYPAVVIACNYKGRREYTFPMANVLYVEYIK